MNTTRPVLTSHTLRSRNRRNETDSQRLARIESRLVALMKHVGMKTDGRNPLTPETEGDDR